MKFHQLCLFFFTLVAVVHARPQRKDFSTYTIVNKAVAPHFTNVFSGSLYLEKVDRPKLIDIMKDIAAVNSAFSFTSMKEPANELFITAMNGQSQVPAQKLVWLVFREKDGVRCYLPKGVTSYEPVSGENITWELMQWDISIPTCGQN